MQDETETTDDSQPLRDLLAVYGCGCAGCGGRCSAHDIISSIALGFKDAPRCLPCLGRGLARDPEELRGQLAGFVRRRECYRRAWAEADRLESAQTPGAVPVPSVPTNPVSFPDPGRVWDAGPMACGELLLALRVRLSSLPPGAVLRLRATDPAAPEDIPAWCRLTGHTLVSAGHPDYHIRRRKE
jgi:tRNA 2-thiouridine synthesizing protein A